MNKQFYKFLSIRHSILFFILYFKFQVFAIIIWYCINKFTVWSMWLLWTSRLQQIRYWKQFLFLFDIKIITIFFLFSRLHVLRPLTFNVDFKVLKQNIRIYYALTSLISGMFSIFLCFCFFFFIQIFFYSNIHSSHPWNSAAIEKKAQQNKKIFLLSPKRERQIVCVCVHNIMKYFNNVQPISKQKLENRKDGVR